MNEPREWWLQISSVAFGHSFHLTRVSAEVDVLTQREDTTFEYYRGAVRVGKRDVSSPTGEREKHSGTDSLPRWGAAMLRPYKEDLEAVGGAGKFQGVRGVFAGFFAAEAGSWK